MTEAGADKILRSITPWQWQTDGKFPEDQTIYALAQMYTRARLHPWAGGEHVLAFMPSHFGHSEVLRKAAVAIHCGQAQALEAYGPHLQRAHLVRRMMLTTLRTLPRSASHADKSGQL
jgi:ABC-type arginine transport system permease subunit